MPEPAGIVLTVPLDLAAVPEAIAAMERFAAESTTPERTTQRMALALDELLANIMMHARPAAPVTVRLWREATSLAAEITDTAAPYDPFTHATPDVAAPLEARPRGGLGIHLVRSLMQTATWRRDAGCNVVTLHAAIPP